MDLGAYAQIEDLDALAKANGIEVPRLRGYRLMVEQEPDYIDDELMHNILDEAINDAVRSKWTFGGWAEYSAITDRMMTKYAVKDPKYGYLMQPNWSAIHGKRRKRLKLDIKHRVRRYRDNYSVHNKYVGKPGILYVHARIGGLNWEYNKDRVIGKPWFIEKIDDPYDESYCDIYARVNTALVKED